MKFVVMSMIIVASVLLVTASRGSKRFPPTPLFQGITNGDYEAGQRLLRQRIEKRYWVGRTEVGFESYLKSQGLATRRMTNSAAPDAPIYGEAEVRDTGICDQVVRVNWRADAQRTLSEIVVSYSSVGCF